MTKDQVPKTKHRRVMPPRRSGTQPQPRVGHWGLGHWSFPVPSVPSHFSLPVPRLTAPARPIYNNWATTTGTAPTGESDEQAGVEDLQGAAPGFAGAAARRRDRDGRRRPAEDPQRSQRRPVEHADSHG